MSWVKACSLVLASLLVASHGSSLPMSDLERMVIETEAKPHVEAVHDKPINYFAADGKSGALNHVNKYGTLEGFDVDLVKEVCRVAGKKCYTVLAEPKECIFTLKQMDYGGDGLMSRWFQGCPGYEITTDRLNNHDFTLPYLRTTSSFAVAPGNPSKFDPKSYEFGKYKIVQTSGSPANDKCLTRLNRRFGKILVVDTLEEAKAAVLDGKADALFSWLDNVEGLEVLSHRLKCSEQGAGIMLTRASYVKPWWDKAFREIYFSGKYTELCKAAEEKYGEAPKCLPGPKEASPELLATMKEETVNKKQGKLWRFVVSGTSPGYSYLDHNGHMSGLTKELIDHVCEIAGKNCVLMSTAVKECKFRVGNLEYPGRGLFEDWFDVCTGYYVNEDRLSSFDFTSAYLTNHETFQVAPGNPSGFDPSLKDYSKFSVAFHEGTESNMHCLNRLHKRFGKVFRVAGKGSKAAQMVLDGKADVYFSTVLSRSSKLETLAGELMCDKVGTGMLVKKGSDVPSWWNPAFEEFYMTGEYNKFCEGQIKRYDFPFPCLPAPATPKAAVVTIDEDGGF